MTLCRKAHLVLGAAGVLALLALPCHAAEGGGFNREIWDLAMKFVNFGILAFVIYKYGKAPLVNFLASKRASVILSFEEIAKQQDDLTQQQEKQNELLAQMDGKIKSIKDYYHRLGQDEKERIMERARAHRDHLLEDAEQRTVREFEKAKILFRREVVELAIELAETRVKQNITVADDRKLVENYIGHLAGMSPHE